MKPCTRCGNVKPLDAYYTDRSKASGHRSICKTCDLAKSRRYYQANREKVIKRVKESQARAAGTT